MREYVEAFLNDMTDEFQARDVDAVLAKFALPTAIFFGSDMVLIRNRSDLANLTEMYLGDLQERKVSKSMPLLKELSEPSEGKLTAVTVSHLMDSEGNVIGLSRGKYFLNVTDDGLKIALVEHSQVPLDVDQHHAALAPMKV